MRKRVTAIAGIAAAVAGAGLFLTPSANAGTQGWIEVCPTGSVCLVEPDGSINSKNVWSRYGSHNLSGVVGSMRAQNNQTGGAGFKLCYGYNGVNCGPVFRATGIYPPGDYTAINSIVLLP